MHLNEVYVTRALDAGARGYLLKDSVDADVIAGVAAVAAGRSFFSPAVTRLLQDAPDCRDANRERLGRHASLSAREREVFQLIAEGHSNKDIAAELDLSVTTVETHRAHILQKLDVHSTRDLVLYAVRCGIIS
jgi:DNA-binding NarL/FixJ family response regulator